MMHNTNPALALPAVNFGFDDLREQMNRFTIRFDEFIEKGRRRLLEERNEFARNVAEDKESARETKSQIEYYKEKEVEVLERMLCSFPFSRRSTVAFPALLYIHCSHIDQVDTN